MLESVILSLQNYTKSKMSVINRKGEVWNIIDDDNYYKNYNIPQLLYTRNITPGIGVTVDGRLYDLIFSNYIECDHGNFKSVISDNMWSDFIALKNNGDLYSGSVNIVDDKPIGCDITLIDQGVDYIVNGSRFDDLLSIKGKVITVWNKLKIIRTVTLDDNEEIVDIYPGVIVTNLRFLVINNMYITETKREGKLIGCGLVEEYDPDTQEWHKLLTAELVNDELVVKFDYLRVKNITNTIDWIDMVTIYGHPFLIDNDGNTLDVLGRSRDKIPSYILTH